MPRATHPAIQSDASVSLAIPPSPTRAQAPQDKVRSATFRSYRARGIPICLPLLLLLVLLSARPASAWQPVPIIGCSVNQLTNSTDQDKATSQTFMIWNDGTGTMEYTISEGASWLSVSPASGSVPTEDYDLACATVFYNTEELCAGEYEATIGINCPSASNTPFQIAVHLTVARRPVILGPNGQSASGGIFHVAYVAGQTPDYYRQVAAGLTPSSIVDIDETRPWVDGQWGPWTAVTDTSRPPAEWTYSTSETITGPAAFAVTCTWRDDALPVATQDDPATDTALVVVTVPAPIPTPPALDIRDAGGYAIMSLTENGRLWLLAESVQEGVTEFDSSSEKKYEIRSSTGDLLLQLMLSGEDKGTLRIRGQFHAAEPLHPPSAQHLFHVEDSQGPPQSILSLDDDGNLYALGELAQLPPEVGAIAFYDPEGNLYVEGRLVPQPLTEEWLERGERGEGGEGAGAEEWLYVNWQTDEEIQNQNGSWGHPFKTIRQARNWLRERSTGGRTGWDYEDTPFEMQKDVIVWILPGRYEVPDDTIPSGSCEPLYKKRFPPRTSSEEPGDYDEIHETIEFNPRHSGNNNRFVTYAGFPGATISGAHEIEGTAFSIYDPTKGIYSHELTALELDPSKKDKWFRDIYISNTYGSLNYNLRGVRARWPNKTFGGYTPYGDNDANGKLNLDDLALYRSHAVDYQDADFIYDAASGARLTAEWAFGDPDRFTALQLDALLRDDLDPNDVYNRKYIRINGADAVDISLLEDILDGMGQMALNRPEWVNFGTHSNTVARIHHIVSDQYENKYLVLSKGRHAVARPWWRAEQEDTVVQWNPTTSGWSTSPPDPLWYPQLGLTRPKYVYDFDWWWNCKLTYQYLELWTAWVKGGKLGPEPPSPWPSTAPSPSSLPLPRSFDALRAARTPPMFTKEGAERWAAANYQDNPMDFLPDYSVPVDGLMYFENAKNWLDASGEWFLEIDEGEDPDSPILYYKPYPEEQNGSTLNEALKVYIPFARNILNIHGEYLLDPFGGWWPPVTPVKNLRFQGLVFEHSLTGAAPSATRGNFTGNCEDSWGQKYSFYKTTPFPYTDEGDPENGFFFVHCGDGGVAGFIIDAGVHVENALDVDFYGDAFRNMGGNGLGLQEESSDCDLFGNTFHDLDAGAVRIETNPQLEATYPTFSFPGMGYPWVFGRGRGWNNVIFNNYFARTGLAYESPAVLIDGPRGTKVCFNEFENIPSNVLQLGTFRAFWDIQDIEIWENYFHNVCNFYTDVGAIKAIPSVCHARVWSTNAYPLGLSMMCGQMPRLDPDDVGCTNDGRIQDRASTPQLYWTPANCVNEMQAVMTGKDNDGVPIENLNFLANCSIYWNTFRSINYRRKAPGPPASNEDPAEPCTPSGIYLDWCAAGRPVGLRPGADSTYARLYLGPNNFFDINTVQWWDGTGLRGYTYCEHWPQYYPDDYWWEDQNHIIRYFYDFPLGEFPLHLCDIKLNHYPAYGGLCYAPWHRPPAGLEDLEKQDMWNWLMVSHQTTPGNEPGPASQPPNGYPPPEDSPLKVETTEYMLSRHRTEVNNCINLGGAPFPYTPGLYDDTINKE